MDWSVDVIGAMTNLMVQFSDLDCVDVDRVRDKLIDAFERLVDYAQTAAESDFSSMSKDMRDVYVDIVWIITQLVNGADAKEKADWERFVNTATNAILIENLPPLMRRETLLCLKSVTQGCVDTSTALKDAIYPNANVKRSRRGDSNSKLGLLGQVFLKCGDFNAQKHIAEILFRLVKANLLEQDVASTIFKHVTSQFKDLFRIQDTAQMFKSLKTLVRHFNAAQGSAASVKSFEAKNLRLVGLQVHDKWVNFGQEMLTVHVVMEDDGSIEPVDILYSNIRAFSMPKKNVAHIGIREKPLGLAAEDPFDIEDDEWIQIEFHDQNVPAVIEQLFRIGKQNDVVEMYITNANLVPSKKMSAGILDVELNSESESLEHDAPAVKPTPVVLKSKSKPKPKKAPRKTREKTAALVVSETESDSEEVPKAVKPTQASRQLPKRKAKQDGIKKLNQQLNDILETSDLAEEPEPSLSPPPAKRISPPQRLQPVRQLEYSPRSEMEDDEDNDNDDDDAQEDEWTHEDIPALVKMIKAKGTTKKQREEYQRVVDRLKQSESRDVSLGKSLFKTPAPSLQAPKTGPRPGILKSPDAKRLKTGPYDSVVDWRKRLAPVQTTKKPARTTTTATTTTTDLNFDDDEDDEDTGGGTLTPLSNFLNASDDVSPLLSDEKAKKKSKTRRSAPADVAAMGDDMVGFQQMMQSLAERNRRIARERIESLVNEFRVESEAASRKFISQAEQEYETFARAAGRQAAERSRESKTIASRVEALTREYKSALRVAYEDFTANKRATVADTARITDDLAQIDAKHAAAAKRLLEKLDAKRRKVATDVDTAARAAHTNDGVKSMLLELARKM